jgi:hypothetical protein
LYKRFCYNSIVIEKLVVEVIKAKEGLDSFYYIRGLLVIDCLYLLRVDLNSFYSYNKPEVFYTFYPKLAFLNINL